MQDKDTVSLEDLYWIWFHRTPGIGPRKVCRLVKDFGSPDKVWKCTEAELKQIEGLTSSDCQALIREKNLDRLWEWAHVLGKRGIYVITRASRYYPPLLNFIFDPPLVLFVRGNPSALCSDAIAVIGSRKCTDYGASAARDCASYLADRGYVVVSGMARGIDSWGHEGALRVGGTTVAVLGCGVDRCYPPENRRLMEAIEAGGAVISELDPSAEALARHFPLRNRIISGMCRGVVIVEAARKSGSLITADQALEQGREVFVVPGSIFSPNSQGGHGLVQQGAVLLTSWKDICDICPRTLGINPARTPGTGVRKRKADTKYEGSFRCGGWDDPELEADAARVLSLIAPEGADQETLCREGNLAPSRFQQIITALELRGLILRMPDQRFIKY